MLSILKASLRILKVLVLNKYLNLFSIFFFSSRFREHFGVLFGRQKPPASETIQRRVAAELQQLRQDQKLLQTLRASQSGDDERIETRARDDDVPRPFPGRKVFRTLQLHDLLHHAAVPALSG